MKKSIIALSVIALTCSMGTFAKGQGGGGQGGDKWNKHYRAHEYSETLEVELLGYIPRSCGLSFEPDKKLTKHGGAAFVDLDVNESQKLGKVFGKCNLPKTKVTLSSTDYEFKNTNNERVRTGYSVEFDQGLGNEEITRYNGEAFDHYVWINVPTTPTIHGVYKSTININVESTFM
ncbi:hypothetical protein ACQKPX_14855 [Photobacterium sp. DNB23_23_1]